MWNKESILLFVRLILCDSKLYLFAKRETRLTIHIENLRGYLEVPNKMAWHLKQTNEHKKERIYQNGRDMLINSTVMESV